MAEKSRPGATPAAAMPRASEAPSPPAAKPQATRKRPGEEKLRKQLHLRSETLQRLGVHASMTHRNESELADEILSAYLKRHGKGKELFQQTNSDTLIEGETAEAA